jgi:hypothetical protein
MVNFFYPAIVLYLIMIKKIEHIGIAVKDLKASNELFKKIFVKSTLPLGTGAMNF